MSSINGISIGVSVLLFLCSAMSIPAQDKSATVEPAEPEKTAAKPVIEVVGSEKDLQVIDEKIAAAKAGTNDVAQALKMVSEQDAQIAAILEQVGSLLEDTASPDAENLVALVPAEPRVPTEPDSVTESSAEPIPGGDIPVRVGLEDNTHWGSEFWSDRGIASVEGGSLVVQTVTGKHRKTAMSRRFEQPFVIDPKEAVTFDVENCITEPIQVALALFQGPVYYETPTQMVKPGKSSLSYKMSAKTFKSASTKWMHSGSFDAPFAISKLTLLIYSAKPATVAFDNLLLSVPGN